MEKLRDKMIIKSLITDSLLARSGKLIAGDTIQEIVSEITERLHDVIKGNDGVCVYHTWIKLAPLTHDPSQTYVCLNCDRTK